VAAIAAEMNQGDEQADFARGAVTERSQAATVSLMPNSISTPNEPEVYDFAYG